MDASHVATGAITGLLASTLVYLSHLPLQPLDMQTAAAIAGLLVALAGGAVKMYQVHRPVAKSIPFRAVVGPGGLAKE